MFFISDIRTSSEELEDSVCLLFTTRAKDAGIGVCAQFV